MGQPESPSKMAQAVIRRPESACTVIIILIGFAKPAMPPGTRQGHGDGSSKGCRCLCKTQTSKGVKTPLFVTFSQGNM